MPKQKELPPGLAEIRAEIDRIDAEVVRMLAIRLSVVEKAAQLKHAHGVPFRDKDREEEIILTASERADELGLPRKPVRKIFRQIVRISTRTQGEHE
jgi:chorismate mutase